MRYSEIVENDDDDEWERKEREREKYESLPHSSEVKKYLIPICHAAQKIYDAWDQSDPYDDELNGGGICHLIADEIASILNRAGMRVFTESSTNEQHVYCVGQFSDGVYEIDIPYRLYETGGGFTWTKIPGVRFTPDYVYVHCLDGNPARMSQYVSDWEEDFS